MAKIYRTSDRIKLNIDDLVVTVSPLSIHQKAQIEEAAQGGGTSQLLKASLLAVKLAVKNIEGLEDSNGEEYKLQKDEDGSLSDSTVDDLFNIHQSSKLISVALNLINGIPSEFYDASTGKEIEGVSFVSSKEKKGKK